MTTECPCKNCVPPTRTPGCHDTCQVKKAWDESVYKPKKEYIRKYCRGNWAYDCFNSIASSQMARRRCRLGKKQKHSGE